MRGWHPDEAGFELGTGCDDVEENPVHRVAGVVSRRAEGEVGALLLQLPGNVARIRNGAELETPPGLLAHVSPPGWAQFLLPAEYLWSRTMASERQPLPESARL